MIICNCGCRGEIPHKSWHTRYPPKYLRGHWRKGKTLSEEHKSKIKQSNKGKNLGRVLSEEHRDKISTSNKGRVISKEHIEKLRQSRLGKERPLSVRQQISTTLTGKSFFTGFRTTLNKRVRSSDKYSDWRTAVFERDDYTCQECGKNNCYLEAHHIVQLHVILKDVDGETFTTVEDCKELWNIDNGIALCEMCHASIDGHKNKFYKGDD